ncbi:MAG: hypothetical protein AAF390_09950 [Pseudomonadota bacterium]
MDTSERIAAVLGPSLLAVTISEVRNLRIWRDVHPTVVYLNGLLFLIAGLIIVTTHNVWDLDLGLLVTLAGWLLAAAGLFRMFFPTAQQLTTGIVTYMVIAALFTLGAVLTIYAVFRLSH